MIQPPLFTEDIFATTDREPPSVRDSETSIAAAKHIEPTAGTLRKLVLDYIRSQGAVGASDEEIQLALSMDGNTERPRRYELYKAGFIAKSDKKRRTSSGLLAVVWVVAGNQ